MKKPRKGGILLARCEAPGLEESQILEPHRGEM